MHLKELLLTGKRGSSKFPGHPYNPTAPTVFMHIPKTAGMALAQGVSDALAPRRTVRGFDRAAFGGFREFDTFACSERRQTYVDPSELPADGDFVCGHIAFSTLLQRYRSANYLTLLREPLSRILSLWLYWRATPDDYLARFGAWAEYVKRARTPLRDFVSCKDVACQVDNVSVRMLVWPHPLIPDEDFIDPRHDKVLLKDALARLKQFSFADIVENPQMPANLQIWLGQSVTYPQINEATGIPVPLKRPLHGELTPETINLIETRARLDLSLWTSLATDRVAPIDSETFRRHTVLRNVARHASVMLA
jgi:hypothetical protein